MKILMVLWGVFFSVLVFADDGDNACIKKAQDNCLNFTCQNSEDPDCAENCPQKAQAECS